MMALAALSNCRVSCRLGHDPGGLFGPGSLQSCTQISSIMPPLVVGVLQLEPSPLAVSLP